MAKVLPMQRSKRDPTIRIPPHSIEAEEAVLGGILIDPTAIARVAPILKPEHFYLNSNQEVYRVALELYRMNYPTDIGYVLSRLRQAGSEEQMGGASTLVRLANAVISTASIDLQAKLIVDKATERQLIRVGGEIAALGWESGEVADKLDLAEQLLYSIRDRGDTRGVEHVSDVCTRIFDRISSGKPPGLSTGMLDLDQLTGGLHPGNLVVVGGDTGMCKSQFGAALAYEIAKRHNRATLVFSMEMESEEVVERWQARVAGVDSQQIRDANLSEANISALLTSIDRLGQLPLYIDPSSAPSLEHIRSQVRRLQSADPALVVIDYLQLMGAAASSSERVLELGRIVRDCKRLAGDFHLSVVLLSQLNREIKNRQNKRPGMHDFRYCGEIEQHANVIFGLYRDEYYNPDTPDKGIVEISVLKQRSGKTGVVKMLFAPEFSWFKNMARGGSL